MRKSATSKQNPLLAKIPAERLTDAATDNHLNDCVVAIEFLNSLSGSNFRSGTGSSIGRLIKLFDRGYTLEEVKSVIESKVKEWRNVPIMKKYIRPSTLFNLSNFKTYLNELNNNNNNNKQKK